MKSQPHLTSQIVRAMIQARAIDAIGIAGCLLVAFVAAKLESQRHKGDACFFNMDLQMALGIAKWERLDAVRRRAIEAGWLSYKGY